MKPTIGRVVLFQPAAQGAQPLRTQPFAAMISFVHSDTLINVGFFDQNGVAGNATSVRLLEPGDMRLPDGYFAEWMPYQISQAMKNEPGAVVPASASMKPYTASATSADPIQNRLVAAGKTAPRITAEYLESIIVKEHYFTAEDGAHGSPRSLGLAPSDDSLKLMTFCVLTTSNGGQVQGSSICASPENFDAQAGREYARKDAISKLWPLEGWLLKQRLHEGALETMNMPVTMDRIARVCHEVNRAYCEALGDTSQPAWEDAPAWQRESARMGVDLHSLGDFGPEASHISWMNQKLAEGWKYGPIKDAALKEHPCIMPFNQLPVEQQAKDFIFRAVVHALNDAV